PSEERLVSRESVQLTEQSFWLLRCFWPNKRRTRYFGSNGRRPRRRCPCIPSVHIPCV
ncbi:acetate kinase, partial [Vibrio parahaemolyticus VPTS-2010_2]